jgi:hypothetical protein
MKGVVRQMRGACLLPLALLAMAACRGEEKGPNGEIKLRGTVHMVQSQDGGTCWKFSSQKGKDYELQPAQVPKEVLVDGAQAVLEAKERGGGSFCKLGPVIDVVKVDSVGAPTTASSQ